jgi:signal transduction histidine kinase
MSSEINTAGAAPRGMQDCGIRIDSEKAERIFNALFTIKRSGMGIGPSISCSIVEAYRRN